MAKVILIYSGGLDTSVCIPMLREDYGYDEIVTVTVDVGQPKEEINSAEKKAKILKTKHYTVDAKSTFASDYIFSAIKANASYQGYPLSTAIARPLIAKVAVDISEKENTNVFAHGCTGKGNDQFRIEYTIRMLKKDAVIIAPMREKNLTRTEEIEYAKQKGVPISQTLKKIWSVDENLWGRSIEGGRLEEIDYEPPEEIFKWTKASGEKINTLKISLQFEKGVPVAINGKNYDSVELIKKLNKIAGAKEIGRLDIIEERILGLKSRENYEAPAAVLILTAHKALESLVLTREELKFKAVVDNIWSELAYFGLWYDPLKEDIEAFIDKTQQRVTGEVYLKLFKGNCKVIGRHSPCALYSEDLVSFDTKTFDQRETQAMVKYHGLSSSLYQQIKNKLR